MLKTYFYSCWWRVIWRQPRRIHSERYWRFWLVSIPPHLSKHSLQILKSQGLHYSCFTNKQIKWILKELYLIKQFLTRFFFFSSPDIDTRRRSACDLVQALCKIFEGPVIQNFSQYVHGLLQVCNNISLTISLFKSIHCFLCIYFIFCLLAIFNPVLIFWHWLFISLFIYFFFFLLVNHLTTTNFLSLFWGGNSMTTHFIV